MRSKRISSIRLIVNCTHDRTYIMI
jgi:hypothetical protein